MIFLPNDDKLAAEARDIVEHVVKKEGRCKVKAWRDVPVDTSVVGRLAKATEPRIVQVSSCHFTSSFSGVGAFGGYLPRSDLATFLLVL